MLPRRFLRPVAARVCDVRAPRRAFTSKKIGPGFLRGPILDDAREVHPHAAIKI